MRISFSPSFTTNQRSVTYIGSLCFVIQACTTAWLSLPARSCSAMAWTRSAMGCGFSRGWVVYYMSVHQITRVAGR